MNDAYDSEDGHGSPRLQAQEVNYKLEPDDPPFLLNERRLSPEGNTTGSPTDKGTHPNGLPPDRPDIAEYENENPHNIGLLPDDDPGPSTKSFLKFKAEPAEPPVHPSQPVSQPPSHSPQELPQAAASALSLLIARESPETETKNLPTDGPKLEPRSPNQPQKQQPHFNSDFKRHVEASENHHLQKRFEPGHLDQELPPILKSPPQPASARSPHNNHQNLPSLQSALGELSGIPPKEPPGRVNGTSPYSFPSVTSSSPSLPRNEMVRERPLPPAAQYPTPQIPLSPYSHLSPASSKDMSAVSSPASQPPYPRKSDISYVTTSYEISPQSAQSPATSYPTPTEQSTVGTCDRTPYGSNTQPNGSIPTGSYKCRHPGCNALPFQTQYLLNSHANVHSQDRPHFCPVEGCPRALGGKGFKRKNEMIRHGLVHNSPGYVCPFCPDQQHKYPRPDNLQRHVRVHHVDKSKDDPELRQVLAQRPEGSTRGRRRRTNT
ncbi:hypothetical protein ASPWEDRAFT_391576 [Aspergillus wentii DTO 134E9]|uniref:C2H2-type domain-containing protein n=1 Tax=Aspergillus wentii DTO 134E9 TaxID=1073089 RepID=A0A1L9RXX6_ASPWE|nr:uncharacterized protein ASPWEDRAFT_391576 [Aspergillus wentii DTO 134E9]OJJ39762.1 hypothetical protein ASPWEDRAFT_391576 [Aspergillus wentii DTO 134E9]